MNTEQLNNQKDVCELCQLLECCCEADRLQVIADNRKAMENGYFPIDLKNNGDIRWIKQEKIPTCELCKKRGVLTQIYRQQMYKAREIILVCKKCLKGPDNDPDDDDLERMLEDYYDYEAEIAMGK